MRTMLMWLAVVTTCWAVEGGTPVVTINGEDVTLRQLEDELLRQEGVTQTEDIVHRYLSSIDWDELDDDDMILEIRGQKLTRLRLVAHLLREHGSTVRRELINIQLARQAVADAGIEVDRPMLVREYRRQERSFAERMRASGQDQVVFEDYLQVKEGKTVEQWMAEEGFRMAAALHELVLRTAEIREETLRQHYDEHFEERFAKPAAVRLSVIHKPWPTVRIGGQEVKDPARRQQALQVMRQLGKDIQSGSLSFAKAWEAWGKPYDALSTDGDVGWVERDGRPERRGGRRLSDDVMQLAWSVDPSEEPILLPPISHEDGVDLVRVEARRPASRHLARARRVDPDRGPLPRRPSGGQAAVARGCGR